MTPENETPPRRGRQTSGTVVVVGVTRLPPAEGTTVPHV